VISFDDRVQPSLGVTARRSTATFSHLQFFDARGAGAARAPLTDL